VVELHSERNAYNIMTLLFVVTSPASVGAPSLRMNVIGLPSAPGIPNVVLIDATYTMNSVHVSSLIAPKMGMLVTKMVPIRRDILCTDIGVTTMSETIMLTSFTDIVDHSDLAEMMDLLGRLIINQKYRLLESAITMSLVCLSADPVSIYLGA